MIVFIYKWLKKPAFLPFWLALVQPGHEGSHVCNKSDDNVTPVLLQSWACLGKPPAEIPMPKSNVALCAAKHRNKQTKKRRKKRRRTWDNRANRSTFDQQTLSFVGQPLWISIAKSRVHGVSVHLPSGESILVSQILVLFRLQLVLDVSAIKRKRPAGLV
jgi:hypothetical protein